MNVHFPAHGAPIKLYRNPLSGHSHKVELMLRLLELPFQTIDVKMAEGEHKSESFTKMNPFGQVPVIDDNGTFVSDSNAILVYLTTRYQHAYQWWPETPVKQAAVQRWFSVSAGEIAFGPAAARLVTVFGASLDHELAKQRAHQLFAIMERTLNAQPYLTGQQINVADIACYSYTAHAPEGGVSLHDYPNIRAWLLRIESLDQFQGMHKTPLAALKQAS
ncbi:glutathione S-transferase [Alteromonas sp. ASW11-36]|uniref:Glutathione S-transferase n=1 Tax=Alteromonas arenosi TaxID=3055817 RepID=A0ABT7SSM2_9ALTE|nr:glutathione S-transferase [Alteromonas sp. ASW11-36]MDM7859188.1 glutathione S-transferase [Alteromonas sp. ASW11-36]